MTEDWSLWGLFFSAFLSSTLLPGGSEVMVAVLASKEESDRVLLVAVASVGNTLGGMSSWLIGRLFALRYSVQRLRKEEHRRALERIQRWGSPVLLLSWLPVIGDPLCVAAGWLRINVFLALCFIAVGKTARYVVIVLMF